MKPGDNIININEESEWLGSTGVILSMLDFEGEPTTMFRVCNLSQHSLPHAIGIWDSSEFKLVTDEKI